MRIYIDTSVINGLFAQDVDIKKETQRFLKNAETLGYKLYISEATIEEIENTPDNSKKILLKEIVTKHEMEILSTTEEAKTLAQEYVKAGLIPKKYFTDAFHIAIASIYNIPAIISWNFEHIVRIKTKLGVNTINKRDNYPEITICSPKEV